MVQDFSECHFALLSAVADVTMTIVSYAIIFITRQSLQLTVTSVALYLNHNVFQIQNGANCGQEYLLRSLQSMCDEPFVPINVCDIICSRASSVIDNCVVRIFLTVYKMLYVF